MSVLIEVFAIVLRADAVISKYPGGFEAFAASVPPGTLCADGELVRVGFMRREDVQGFVARLEQAGLVFMSDGRAQDFVPVDEVHGLHAPCDWAEFARVPWLCAPLGPVAICRRPGSAVEPIVTPEGWDYQRSLSKPPEWVMG